MILELFFSASVMKCAGSVRGRGRKAKNTLGRRRCGRLEDLPMSCCVSCPFFFALIFFLFPIFLGFAVGCGAFTERLVAPSRVREPCTGRGGLGEQPPGRGPLPKQGPASGSAKKWPQPEGGCGTDLSFKLDRRERQGACGAKWRCRETVPGLETPGRKLKSDSREMQIFGRKMIFPKSSGSDPDRSATS